MKIYKTLKKAKVLGAWRKARSLLRRKDWKFRLLIAKISKLIFQKYWLKRSLFLYLLLCILYYPFNFRPKLLGIDLIDGLSWLVVSYLIVWLTRHLLEKLKGKGFWERVKKLGSLLIISIGLFVLIDWLLSDNDFWANLFLIVPFVLVLALGLVIAICFSRWLFRFCFKFLRLAFSVAKKHPRQLAISFLILIVFTSLFSFGRFLYHLDKRLTLIEKKLGGQKKLVCDEQQAIEKVRASTVRIIGGTSEGTGFFIKESGIVLTNFHVIEFEPSPKVILPNYEFKTAEIILGDRETDIALLKVEGQNFPALSLGDSKTLEEMEKVYVIGYPLGTALRGKSTVAQGTFVSWRDMKDQPLRYLQIDGNINPGASGGPVITSCGEVVGIATAGISVLGLAISSESAQDKWLSLLTSQERPQIQPIVFEPEKGPKQAVEAFYNYIKTRKLKEAYDLVSQEKMKGTSFDEWVKGYTNTLDVSLIDVYEVEDEKDTVFVKITSLDLVEQDIVSQYFEGTWQTQKEGHLYRLSQSNIKEVENPDFDWFWTKEQKERLEELYLLEE